MILPLRRLHTHPQNMRRIYNRRELRTLAASLRAHAKNHEHGNLIALLIVPDDNGDFWVVDGNRRIAAGALLGNDCPPFNCEIIQADRAEQLLTMSIANSQRSDPDLVSEGLHYKRLMEQEGLNISQICKRTGIYRTRVEHCLAITQLDEPIQDLIAADSIPHDRRVVDALLGLPNSALRLRVAANAAENGDTIKIILAVCEKLTQVKAAPARPKPSATGAPSLDLAGPLPGGKTRWPKTRESAKQTCDSCIIKQDSLISREPEPAWQLFSHAADMTCNACNLRDLQDVCGQCPLVVMLKTLKEAE